MDPLAQSILKYWFDSDLVDVPASYTPPPAFQKKWFGGGATVDEEVKSQFGEALVKIAAGQYDAWQAHPHNAMAGIILMDQFSRNAYRGTPQAFALDAKCITWVQHVHDTGLCAGLPFHARFFLLVPFMHSEELAVQDRGVALFRAEVEAAEKLAAAGGPDAAAATAAAGMLSNGQKFATAHRDVIAKWGRFPHRNAWLGRASTEEEAKGIAEGTIPKF